MIKVNLLDSVTDKAGGLSAIETRVASPRVQSRLLLFAVIGLTLLAVGFDYRSATSAQTEARTQLENQQRIAAQMELVKKEQAELEKKTQDVQVRIDAIKRLRTAQQGPVSVLSAINDRLPQIPNFRLASIEQKDGSLTIAGDSPNEAAVTQFGRSLEFSSGQFSNVSIETKREVMQVAASPSAGASPAERDAPKPVTVSFTVKCKYTPASVPTTAPASANRQPAGSVPVAGQIAQN